jgi:hypothetical protein
VAVLPHPEARARQAGAPAPGSFGRHRRRRRFQSYGRCHGRGERPGALLDGLYGSYEQAGPHVPRMPRHDTQGSVRKRLGDLGTCYCHGLAGDERLQQMIAAVSDLCRCLIVQGMLSWQGMGGWRVCTTTSGELHLPSPDEAQTPAGTLRWMEDRRCSAVYVFRCYSGQPDPRTQRNSSFERYRARVGDAAPR